MIKNILRKMIGSLVVGSLVIGGLTSSANAYTIIDNESKLDIVNQYKSPGTESIIYELSNGATLVINDEQKIYELFVEELGDWSLECETKEELLKCERIYYKSKNKTNDYSNENIKVNESTFNGMKKYDLTNTGIEIFLDGEKALVCFPMFGDVAYKTNTKDVENLIRTYLECVNDMKDKDFSIDDIYQSESNATVVEFNDGSMVLVDEDKNLYEFYHADLGDWGLKVDDRNQLINVIKTYMENKYNMSEDDINNHSIFKSSNLFGTISN